MRLDPVASWTIWLFQYTGGFDIAPDLVGAWVEKLISSEAETRDVRVFDPFAGCGTALLAAERCGVESSGIDRHPFVTKIAQAKLAYRSSPIRYAERAKQVLASARRQDPSIELYAPLIRKCYSDMSLKQLDSLRRTIEDTDDNSETAQLLWLTLVAILRSTSHIGTANWQYLLPSRQKARVQVPFDAFERMMQTIYEDMRSVNETRGPRASCDLDYARLCETIPSNSFNLVVTSPPYPNNYDYADATRLELTFLGEVKNWKDLQANVRQYLLRSCTQHVPDRSINLGDVLARSELDPIRDELRSVCEELGEVRLTRGGRKTYHNMVACYFLDLAQVWLSLRRVCNSPSRVCFVVGDSAPYGVYVPVIEWLGKLAHSAGFSSFRFEKTRDRNTKWKNRKHRVPLCERHLWVEG